LRGTVAAALARATAARAISYCEAAPKACRARGTSSAWRRTAQLRTTGLVTLQSLHTRDVRRRISTPARSINARSPISNAIGAPAMTIIFRSLPPLLVVAIAAAGCTHEAVREVATESAVEVGGRPRLVGEIEGHINVTGTTPAPGETGPSSHRNRRALRKYQRPRAIASPLATCWCVSTSRR
jgi:hypothetical protein